MWGDLKSPPTLIRKFKMRLSVFTQYQNESDEPFMCYKEDHSMPLVPIMNNDLTISLKCFVDKCGFNLNPGLATYNEIQKKLSEVV